MKAFFTLDNLALFAMVAAIVVIAQLASIPISGWLQKEGLPR